MKSCVFEGGDERPVAAEEGLLVGGNQLIGLRVKLLHLDEPAPVLIELPPEGVQAVEIANAACSIVKRPQYKEGSESRKTMLMEIQNFDRW